MKDSLQIILTLILSAYMLIMSSGFTISHIHCSNGEQWIIGTETPPCKNSSETKKCQYLAKCHKVTEKDNDKRNKDIFDFRFEFIGNKASFQEVDFTTYFFDLTQTIAVSRVNLFSAFLTKKDLLRFHSPPDLFKPNLTQLQVFII